jgi:hypothetical protein
VLPCDATGHMAIMMVSAPIAQASKSKASVARLALSSG